MGSPEPMRGALELSDVVVRYAAHKPPAVNGVAVSIPPSSKVACVGRSGSGKSTLLRALARMYPLDGGAIRLDGVDLAAVPLDEVRAVVRFVAPEPILLDGSLMANLLAFESQERMTRATDAAECGNAYTVAEGEAWDVLGLTWPARADRALPRRLQTPAKSADFSAGELQLFSLARALVAGRGAKALRALLCDEPTSALDMASDRRVHDAHLAQRDRRRRRAPAAVDRALRPRARPRARRARGGRRAVGAARADRQHPGPAQAESRRAGGARAWRSGRGEHAGRRRRHLSEGLGLDRLMIQLQTADHQFIDGEIHTTCFTHRHAY